MGPTGIVRPLDRDPAVERRDRWLCPALGVAGLAAAIGFAAATGAAAAMAADTMLLVVLALAWLAGSAWWQPRRTELPWLVPILFAGLLILCALLAVRSPAFFAFGWVGYPYAFTLFSGYWVLIAVTATAVGQYAGLIAIGVPSDALVFILPIGIFVPVVVAGWIGVVEDRRRRRATAELAAANRQLEAALAENAGLHTLLLERARESGQVAERQRLARDIHDTLAQGLTGIVTQVRAAERAADDPDQWRFHLGRVESLARESLAEVRRSVQALRPGGLADSQLPAALAALAERWSEAHEVPATVQVTGVAGPLPTAIEVALFRAAQEGLTNVARHARASRAGLTLSYLDDVVLLDLRDDGVGFDPGASATGFGLAAMRQRLRAVAGTLEIESSDGQGTAISIQVPRTTAEE